MKIFNWFNVLIIVFIIASCDENANVVTQTESSSSQDSSFTDVSEDGGGNNTIGTAFLISRNIRYEFMIDSPTDEDYFQVNLISPDSPIDLDAMNYWIDLTNLPSGINYGLEVYSTGGTLYYSSATGYVDPGFSLNCDPGGSLTSCILQLSDGWRIMFRPVEATAAGDYIIKVFPNGSSAGEKYILHVW